MGSKKEEEKNEKIIRGLMKLPPNRRCINCNSLGPQYVCTNFWTFICIACSGIHREFTHRVKSVSMAKFTAQEVEALQMGGNQRARELFLKDWDMQQMRFPNSSNPDKLREFIRNVYVNKKYAGTRSSDKPPRDTQSIKGPEEDHRRASSYHSFSQSPPYDHQYEERRYGKQAGMLTRKPGSDRGHYEGKISSFIYSPGRPGEQMYEDRFANENSGSRISDFSVSSAGDPFRLDAQSPNFRDPGYGSSPSQVRDILAEDTGSQTLKLPSEFNVKRDSDKIPHLDRTASSGSFGSTDSNSVSLKSANSGSLVGAALEPEQSSGVQLADRPANPSSSKISSARATNGDLFNPLFSQQAVAYSVPAIDLFADVSHQPSLTAPSEQTPPSVPFEAKFTTSTASINLFEDVRHQPSQKLPSEQSSVENTGDEGWATFDLPHQVGPPFEANKGFSSVMLPSDEAPKKLDVFPSIDNASEWFTVQSSASHGHSLLMPDQWHVGLNDVNEYANSRNPQSWNAFDDPTGNVPQTSLGSLPPKGESQVLLHRPSTSVDQYTSLKTPEIPFKDMFASPPVDDKVSTFDVDESSFPPSALNKGGITLERKSTNPFDLPFDSDPEPDNLFLDMSSIQAALPDQQLSAMFLGDLSQPWFQQNTHTAFIPPAPQGGLAYIGGQVPSSQLPNIPSQGPVASLGGNPFA